LALHHIAIATGNLEAMVSFYKKIPGLEFLEWKYDTENQRRSGWFQTAGGILLMIEKKTYSRAPEALVFSYPSGTSIEHFPILRKTEFTVYISDPDGNTLGFSRYPEPIQ